MAPKALTPSLDGAEADTDAPTLPEVSRLVAEYALAARPNAVGCRIVIDLPGGLADTLAVHLGEHLGDDLEARIEAFFRDKVRPGEWIKGRSVAVELDVDPDGGHFRSTMARMARPGGKLQSNRSQGYRLATG